MEEVYGVGRRCRVVVGRDDVHIVWMRCAMHGEGVWVQRRVEDS